VKSSFERQTAICEVISSNGQSKPRGGESSGDSHTTGDASGKHVTVGQCCFEAGGAKRRYNGQSSRFIIVGTMLCILLFNALVQSFVALNENLRNCISAAWHK
jgi:hypothetical protein